MPALKRRAETDLSPPPKRCLLVPKLLGSGSYGKVFTYDDGTCIKYLHNDSLLFLVRLGDTAYSTPEEAAAACRGRAPWLNNSTQHFRSLPPSRTTTWAGGAIILTEHGLRPCYWPCLPSDAYSLLWLDSVLEVPSWRALVVPVLLRTDPGHPPAQLMRQGTPLPSLSAPDMGALRVFAVKLMVAIITTGFFHNDVKADNVVWDPTTQSFRLIDLESIQAQTTDPLSSVSQTRVASEATWQPAQSTALSSLALWHSRYARTRDSAVVITLAGIALLFADAPPLFEVSDVDTYASLLTTFYADWPEMQPMLPSPPTLRAILTRLSTP